MSHIPVLLQEVLQSVQPAPSKIIVDATFGVGGYTRAFLERGANVVAFDRDPYAIRAGQELEREASGRLQLVHAPFSQMASYLQPRFSPQKGGRLGGGLTETLDPHPDPPPYRSGHCPAAAFKCLSWQASLGGRENKVDAIVMDLGISSMQIDEPERGFSFRKDGPLDMRMSNSGQSAADLVNTLSEKELADLFYQYGEEKRSRAIAKAIVARRAEKPFMRTTELAALIEQTIGRHPRDKIHPATRSFQALRIAVNQELEELATALHASTQLLKSGGVLAVVSFHSLEDRMVKQFFAPIRAPSRHVPAQKLTKAEWDAAKPITPTAEEIKQNPRARSARLRFARKI